MSRLAQDRIADTSAFAEESLNNVRTVQAFSHEARDRESFAAYAEDAFVQKLFDAILDTLVAEERVELRNFGVFAVRRRAPRKARHPRTGEKILVPEKCVVTFKAGQVIKERVEALAHRSGEC